MSVSNIKQQYEQYVPKDNAFYRRYYHYFFYGVMIIIVLLMGMIGLLAYQIQHRPLPIFYAAHPPDPEVANAAKETMRLVPFATPNLLPDTILRWAVKAATTAYTFDYVNYLAQLQLARPYFTEAGWQLYLRSVDALIDNIIQNQLFVNGVVAGTPVISNEGPLPGREKVWRIQVPFLVSYQSASVVTKNNFLVIMTIVQVPTRINAQGIGIDQFLMVGR